MDEKEIKRIIRRAKSLEKKHARLIRKINKLSVAYNNLVKDMMLYAPEQTDVLDDIYETFGIELKKKEV